MLVTKRGGPEVLTVGDRPVREPGPGEIRIRATAAAVNPTDIGVRTFGVGYGAPDQVPPPWTPDVEVAGVVESIGHAVPWKPGQRVLAIVLPNRPEGGAQAELAGYAIQLRKLAGLRAAADAKPSDAALVRALGADVIVPRSDDVGATFRAAVPGGVDGMIDGAVLDAGALGAVRDGGALVTVRGWSGPSERGIRIEPVMVSTYAHEAGKLAELVRLVTEGQLTLRVAGTLPVERVAEAQQRLAAGGVRGRLVLTF